MYTLSEVAKKLGLHYNTIYSFVRSGKLKAYKFGRSYRVSEVELKKYIEGKKFKVDKERQ